VCGAGRHIVSGDDLRHHCAEGGGLARFKLPRYIKLVHEPLPATSTGKVVKSKVKDILLTQSKNKIAKL
ncbi:hypothetical protein CYMTET_6814, partial [Cymbomonas tetramitiformis]